MPKISSKYVPTIGPTSSPILWVGECPGEIEDEEGQPFVGATGQRIFNPVLLRNGIAREDTRITNVCHYRPDYNNFDLLIGSPQLQEGLIELKNEILTNRPNVVCAMGSEALTALTGKKGINIWRGSILPCVFDPTIKVIPTFHPAMLFRQMKYYPVLDIDVRRVVLDSSHPRFDYPQRQIIVDPTPTELQVVADRLCQEPLLGTDIETVKNSRKILCIGFSPKPDFSVCIPWTPFNLNTIERILSCPAEKIFHYGIFDQEILHLNGVPINNYVHDTMEMQHVLEPELPRSLAFLTSIRTREPYYKHSGKDEIPKDEKSWNERTTDKKDLWTYNGKDCCVTTEVFHPMLAELKRRGMYLQYRYRMRLFPVAADISRAGLPIDAKRHKEMQIGLQLRWAVLQRAFDYATGLPNGLNVKSPKVITFLYDALNLPEKKSKEGKRTANEDAIIALIGFVKTKYSRLVQPKAQSEWFHKLKLLQTILKIRSIRQLLSVYINVPYSEDGRVRSTYKVPGTETGRLSCDKYVDGTGFNGATLPRDEYDIGIDDLTINLTDQQKADLQGFINKLMAQIQSDEGEEDAEEAA